MNFFKLMNHNTLSIDSSSDLFSFKVPLIHNSHNVFNLCYVRSIFVTDFKFVKFNQTRAHLQNKMRHYTKCESASRIEYAIKVNYFGTKIGLCGREI